MKFTINKQQIENIVSSMQPFLEKKDASAITSHIYLEVVNNKLNLKATDYEMGLEANIDDITDYEDGKATVNGSNLLNIIRRLKNDNINFVPSFIYHIYYNHNLDPCKYHSHFPFLKSYYYIHYKS